MAALDLSPHLLYDMASRAMARSCQTLGTQASERLLPRRIFGGWWSPLFDLVLRVPEVPRA